MNFTGFLDFLMSFLLGFSPFLRCISDCCDICLLNTIKSRVKICNKQLLLELQPMKNFQK